MFLNKYKKSFTLIEMLIVIVIIGILAAALIPRLMSAQERTRDTIRKKDINTLKSALKIYYTDNNKYPNSSPCPPTTVPNGSWCNSIESLSGGYWIGNKSLSPYLTLDPIDPKPSSIPKRVSQGAGTYFYFSYSVIMGGCNANQFYLLLIGMELTQNMGNDTKLCDGSTYVAGNGRAFSTSAINGN